MYFDLVGGLGDLSGALHQYFVLQTAGSGNDAVLLSVGFEEIFSNLRKLLHPFLAVIALLVLE